MLNVLKKFGVLFVGFVAAIVVTFGFYSINTIKESKAAIKEVKVVHPIVVGVINGNFFDRKYKSIKSEMTGAGFAKYDIDFSKIAKIKEKEVPKAECKEINSVVGDYKYLRKCKLSESDQKYVYSVAVKYNVPYKLVMGIMYTESGFDKNARNVNSNGSTDSGIMQINSINKKHLSSKGFNNWKTDWKENVEAGILLISEAYTRRGTIDKAAMDFHHGPGGANKRFKKGQYTSYYSDKVNKHINFLWSE